ncbi:hypothetical protein CHS0354_008463 [Potamilus streckersoni]|uniref:Uncharacterized protein n=1 Tax=Potamilus streckersoni TaxID=2493646 RepID=A0AAE0VHS5_9BIVA|nr:hypothetical protein CHS0354_008463 [Potamilus streckersoni]
MNRMGRLLESNANEEPSEYDGMEKTHLLDRVLDWQESTDDRFAQNPEALLDMITMTSLRGRYGYEHVQEESRRYSNDDVEFEHYVQQFPIDDKISECFLSSDDVMRKKSSFLAGGRRPTFMRCQNWKKKMGWKSSGLENNALLMKEDDSRSSGSKRSRTIRRLLHMPRKSKPSAEKTANSCIPDASSTDILTTWNNPCQDITNSYKRWDEAKTTCQNEKSGEKGRHSKQNFNAVNMDPSNVNSGNRTLDNTKHDLSYQLDKGMSTLMDTADAFSPILVDDATNTIHHIRTLDPPVALRMRDKDGNNLLHRCVMMGQSEAVAETLVRFPGMCSDLNNDRMTPLELAAKIGQVSCLQYLLDKTLNCNVLGLSLISRLLTVSAVHGKEECMELLLERMPVVEHDQTMLPRDRRGNTAAHVAATHGQLSCLQLLVRKGFDICARNSLGQRPSDISQQLKHQDCFQYLLLVEACRSLIDSRMRHCLINERLQNEFLDIIAYLEQLRCDLQQVQNLFIDTRQSLEDNKECAINNLSLLHTELGNFITNVNKAVDREEGKRKLNEFKAQIEMLEDTFEFSPLAGIENAIARLLRSMHDAIQTTDSSTEAHENQSSSEISVLFSIFLQKIHEESTADFSSTFQTLEKLWKQRTLGDSTVTRDKIFVKKTCSSGDVTLSTESNCTVDKTHLASLSNVSKDHSATVYLPRACNLTMENQSLIHDDCMDSSVKSNDYEMLTCSYVSQGSPEANTSVYTQTLTSVTPDTSPEETSQMTLGDGSNTYEESFISNDVTSDSHSYWWDLHEIHPEDCVHVEEDVRHSGVKLNLENEDAPNEQLRKERLRNHLFSMQSTRNPSKDFIETITTAAGKHYGGPNSWQKRTVVNVSEACSQRDKGSFRYSKLSSFKPNRKLKVNNFNVTDVVKSQLIPDKDISETCKPSDVCPSTFSSISWHENNGSV